jgi:hypothetical protein
MMGSPGRIREALWLPLAQEWVLLAAAACMGRAKVAARRGWQGEGPVLSQGVLGRKQKQKQEASLFGEEVGLCWDLSPWRKRSQTSSCSQKGQKLLKAG